MGIFGRIFNMGRAKINSTLDDMEKPIELLDQKIRDMEKDYSEAKRASATVLGNLSTIKKEMEYAAKQSKEWEEKVALAMSQGNEELARLAGSKSIEFKEKYNSLNTSYASAKIQGDKIKANLSELAKEIEKTRTYRDEARARVANADASKAINEIFTGTAKKGDSIDKDAIERKIQQKEAYAEGLSELRSADESLDKKFKDLEKQAEESEVDKLMAKYRKQ